MPFAAGSATDQLARALGQEVTRITKQAVVVDNKPGASGFIGAEAAKKAAPDGYTVFITTNTTHAANEHLFKKLPYDPVKDFVPVTGLGKGGQIMIVNLERAGEDRRRVHRAREGEAGQAQLRQRQLVVARRGRDVPADGRRRAPARAVQEQSAGDQRSAGRPDQHDDHRHGDRPAAGQGRQGARARRVAPPSARRSRPTLPTIDEAGVKGYDMGFWFAAYVPANTPPAVVSKLHDVLVEATKGPAMQQFYATTGTDPFTTTPAELGKFQVAESEKWKSIIKKAGIEPE